MKNRKRSKCNVMICFAFLMLCCVRLRYVMLCSVLFCSFLMSSNFEGIL